MQQNKFLLGLGQEKAGLLDGVSAVFNNHSCCWTSVDQPTPQEGIHQTNALMPFRIEPRGRDNLNFEA